MWLFRRVLAVWLTLLIVCVAGVVVGRLDHAANPLEKVGFGVCDGETCIRGTRLGTDWQSVLVSFPKATVKEGSLKLSTPTEDIQSVSLSNEGTSSLQVIEIWDSPSLFTLSAGDIVSLYGRPCQLFLQFEDGHSNTFLLVYPTLTVGAWMLGDDANQSDNLQIQPDSPITSFQVKITDPYATCDDPKSEFRGTWHGFTSADIYRARNLRALGSQQP